MFKSVYKDKVVLVTGNTGFKGSWLTSWLLMLGAKVVGISDRVPTQPSMFEICGLDKKINHHTADVNDHDALVKIITTAKPDFVFHLAAQAIVSKSYADPLTTLKTNIIGTANMLEALHISNHPCTAVFITSDKCYENVEWTWGYRENDRLGGKDPYSASKAGAEIVFYTYYHSFFNKPDCPVKLVTGRAGNVIGGGDWAQDRIIPDCVRSWSENKPVLIRRPQSTRPWQHVLEPVSGYLNLGMCLFENPSLTGESFNFGPTSDQTFTVLELINEVAKNWTFKSKQDQVKIEQAPAFHEAGLLKLNCDKALHYLGWKPVLKFQDTARLTAQWYDQFYHANKAHLFDKTIEQVNEYLRFAKDINPAWIK